jgi:glycosyltransferase involved in cell wall biosynthesis
MRVMLIIASMVAGGAQRVMCLLANRWARLGWDVTLVTLATPEGDFYTLEASIRRIGLGLETDSAGVLEAIANNRTRVGALRRLIKEGAPDAVVSFQDRMNVVSLLAARGTGVPVVVSERTDPRKHPIGRPWNLLRRWTYPRAERVVAQTESVAEWLRGIVAPERIAVLPNPVEAPQAAETRGLRGLAGLSDDSYVVLGVGRLVPQKGFDVLVEAFARAAGNRPDWHLMILGDGPERERLMRLATELAISERFHLPGNVQGVGRYTGECDVFVLSSRYEGFPNALLEAMAAGAAVIATDCLSGPRDIVRSGTDGLLVAPDDATALANAIQRLMADEQVRRRLGAAGREVTVRFGFERIGAGWDALLAQVAPAARAK